jgi:hypothetical protein
MVMGIVYHPPMAADQAAKDKTPSEHVSYWLMLQLDGFSAQLVWLKQVADNVVIFKVHYRDWYAKFLSLSSAGVYRSNVGYSLGAL